MTHFLPFATVVALAVQTAFPKKCFSYIRVPLFPHNTTDALVQYLSPAECHHLPQPLLFLELDIIP